VRRSRSFSFNPSEEGEKEDDIAWRVTTISSVIAEGTGEPCVATDRTLSRVGVWYGIATNVHERGSWWLLMMLLMPDHVHMLAAFPDGNGPAPAVRNWKRFAARHFGVKWQRDFFDHRIRHDESLEGKESNIRLNPVRAGLVDRPEDWPHIITPGWNFR